MRPLYEKVPQSSRASFYVSTRADPSFPFNWHYHPEFELTLIVDSSGQRLVGDGIADYESGDLALIGPNLPHSWRSGPGAARIHRAVIVQFREGFLGESFFKLDEMAAVARLLKRADSGLAFNATHAAQRVQPTLASLPSMAPAQQLVALLSVLNELALEDVPPLSISRHRPTYRIEYQGRVDRLCAYLERHFDEEINYEAVARLVHMDQASLCRFFKRATGRTITVYVNELRIAAATHLLTTSDLSVLEIGGQVGFGNHSNFNRQFTRFKGVSPGAIRKQFKPVSSSA